MVRRSLIFLALVSCGKDSGPPTKPDPTTTATCDGTVTWESFAEGFVDTWCTGCHSVTVVGDDRNFAPVDANFDTYADVVDWAPRILQAVADDQPWMPPQGGVSQEDRDLLREWIECGTPGEDDVATGCDAATRIPGDQVVGAADVATLCADSDVVIEGSLTTQGAVTIDCLCEVVGDVVVEDALTAPILTGVGGLDLTGASGVVLPELIEVGGELQLVGTSLTGILLPELTTVAGNVVIQGNPSLAAVAVPRLGTIGGELRIEDNDALVDLTETRAVDRVQAIRVLGNDALVDLNAFRFVYEVGDIEIAANAQLTEVAGIEVITDLTGDVHVSSNPMLRRLGGLDSLVDLHGTLRIEDNVALEEVVGFGNLATIDGDLAITGNLAFPGADADAFANGIAVGGAVDVSGNGP